MLKAGTMTQAQIAGELGVSTRAVRAWNKECDSDWSLPRKKPAGRPPKLGFREWDSVMVHVLLQKYHYRREKWPLRRIRKLIGVHFDVWYNTTYLHNKIAKWMRDKAARRWRRRSPRYWMIDQWFFFDVSEENWGPFQQQRPHE
jgi:transposase